ncbi:DUF1266 domain-containing protein [Clostridium uliginosum]|uniref:DUF1266 domain-containing protein n=1 Tax=Clostridium uliginosum TaxID=119641 RepID=A0A1I1HD65_9CLOT|nr:DUF1266 domain-containing protein [Clostridium uliginosum]SFC21947.1 Protein of unknown function [Clostridium uliginosum]
MKNLRKLSSIVVAWLISSILFVSCASSNSSSSKKNEVLNEKQRLLAYGAVLSSRNNMAFDELKTTNEGVKEVLKEGWDVTSKETAIEALEWLVNEGHREEADEVYNVIKSGEGGNYPDLNKTIQLYDKANSTMKAQLGFKDESFNNVKTVAAWDTDRLVTVARWSYSADYITEEEAWNYINKAVSMAKSSFNSWEEYYISCAYGRAIAYEGDIDELIGTGKALFKNSDSVWKKCNFK